MKAKFFVGQKCSATYLCDSDTVYTCEIVGRTEKTVLVKDHSGTRRCKIYNYREEAEVILPQGHYSMAISICADRPEVCRD
jgi:hypothetical protein